MCELPGGKGVWLRKKYIPASLMFLHTFAYIFSDYALTPIISTELQFARLNENS